MTVETDKDKILENYLCLDLTELQEEVTAELKGNTEFMNLVSRAILLDCDDNLKYVADRDELGHFYQKLGIQAVHFSYNKIMSTTIEQLDVDFKFLTIVNMIYCNKLDCDCILNVVSDNRDETYKSIKAMSNKIALSYRARETSVELLKCFYNMGFISLVK